MQKTYELTLIFSPETAEKKAKEVLAEQLKRTGGELKKSDFWGKKDFTYPIKKNNSGIYLFSEVLLDAKQLTDLSNRLKINEEVLRYLLVTKSSKEAKAEK